MNSMAFFLIRVILNECGELSSRDVGISGGEMWSISAGAG